jgi:hypothetical protein
VESFDGPAGLPRFREGLKRLLDDQARTGARLVLVSPPCQEALGPPLPDPSRHNADLACYRDALRALAAERKLAFLDLFAWHRTQLASDPATRWTSDGLHLTSDGYLEAARWLADGLGAASPREWNVVLDGGGRVVTAEGAQITNLKTEAGDLRFEIAASLLPDPLPPEKAAARRERAVVLEGLAPGRYVVQVDGHPVSRIEGGGRATVTLGPDRDAEQAEQLRAAIRAKNLLFFHRWRPQNETYLFGFRKHEQGQNAREIVRFDPLIAEQESRIAVLRRPAPHTIEVIREEQAR